MAQYKVTAPDGQRYLVTGPDNATHEQILEQVQNHHQFESLRNSTPKELSLGDVAKGAMENFIPSAVGTAKSMIDPVMHPIDTVNNLWNTAEGELSKFVGAGDSSEKYANALNSYFGNRYGSMEGFKQAVATDPVGVASDLSAVFSAGGTAAARAPGLIGKFGKIAAKVGDVTNPVSVVAKGIKKIAPLGADIVGHLATHTGSDALKIAAEAGAKAGKASEEFLNHMRGNSSVDEIVNSAKTAVGQLRAERAAAYRGGMQQVSNDKTILDFNDIDSHVAKTSNVKQYKGQDLSPETKDIRKKVSDAISEWKALDPAEFHTVEGFDALKQRISSLRDSLPYNSPERLIADNAYHAVREAIVKQAPTYAKVMKDYEEASDQINEIQKTLSLNPRASVDTAARKLLSTMRNNVNTNFGKRADLAKTLAQHGAPELAEQLAGQTLNKMTPRGLGAAEAAVPIATAIGGHPAALAALPFMSPRLMGETAHAAGRVFGSPGARYAPMAGQVLRQMSAPQRAQDAQTLAQQLGLQP